MHKSSFNINSPFYVSYIAKDTLEIYLLTDKTHKMLYVIQQLRTKLCFCSSIYGVDFTWWAPCVDNVVHKESANWPQIELSFKRAFYRYCIS